MPRGLSQSEKTYNGPVAWLVKITSRAGTVFRFCSEAPAGGLLFAGFTWQKGLRNVGPIRWNRSAQVECETLELSNADFSLSKIAKQELLEGAECEISLALLALGSKIDLFFGYLTEMQETAETILFRPVSHYDPGSWEVPWATYTTDEFPTLTPKNVSIAGSVQSATGGGGGGIETPREDKIFIEKVML
jgi:hypothetical protein